MNLRNTPPISKVTVQAPPGSGGRRKALIIAIMYEGQVGEEEGVPFELEASHQGASLIKKFLMDYHKYAEQDIVMLLDDGIETEPTKDNIVRALEELVRDAEPDDRFFVFYSGHGSQIININETEKDGFDEVILCLDWNYKRGVQKGSRDYYENFIMDDDLNRILVGNIPVGAHLVVLFDCCNSGTMMDLEFTRSYSPLPLNEEPEDIPEHMKDSDNNTQTPHPANRGSCHNQRRSSSGGPLSLPYAVKVNKRKSSMIRENSDESTIDASNRSDVISWSSSLDGQQSWQHRDTGGMMANAFVESMTENPDQTYRELLVDLTLKKRCSTIPPELKCGGQQPQLGFNKRPDMNAKVTF